MRTHEQIIESHMQAREMREHLWYQHKERDMPPVLCVRWRDRDMQMVEIQKYGAMLELSLEKIKQLGRTDHPFYDEKMSVPLVLYTALEALKDGVAIPGILDPPKRDTLPMETIMLAVEGYGVETDDQEYAEKIRRGELEQDFKENPASKVYERLTTYLVETSATGSAEWARVTSSMHFEDGGRMTWGEAIVSTSEETVLDNAMDGGGFDRLLDIMTPHVTRENLT